MCGPPRPARQRALPSRQVTGQRPRVSARTCLEATPNAPSHRSEKRHLLLRRRPPRLHRTRLFSAPRARVDTPHADGEAMLVSGCPPVFPRSPWEVGCSRGARGGIQSCSSSKSLVGLQKGAGRPRQSPPTPRGRSDVGHGQVAHRGRPTPGPITTLPRAARIRLLVLSRRAGLRVSLSGHLPGGPCPWC